MTTIDPFTKSAIDIIKNETKTIQIPSNERDIMKLLKLCPIFLPVSAHDSTILNRTRRQDPIGVTLIIFALENGLIVSLRGNEYRVENYYDISDQREGELIALYERALNECDTMLIMFLGGIERKNSEKAYDDYVKHLVEQLDLPYIDEGYRRIGPIQHLLTKLPEVYILEDEIRLHKDGCVTRRALIPWIQSASDLQHVYFYVPIDFSILDTDTSSYRLLETEGKGYDRSEELVLHILRTRPFAFLQLYRIGKAIMTRERTEAIIYFIWNSEDRIFKLLNKKELVLMGGVLNDTSVKGFIKEIVTEDHELDRSILVFTYLSTVSNIPHCIFDIVTRRPSFNVLKILHSLVSTRGEDSVELAFALIQGLMEAEYARVDHKIVESFDKFKYLIRIIPSDPIGESNEELMIFEQRYLLTKRRYVHKPEEVKEKPLVTEDAVNSIVVKKATYSQNGKFIQPKQIPSSILVIYNGESGKVEKDIREDARRDDEFLALSSESISEIMKIQGATESAKRVQLLFSDERRRLLIADFEAQEGYRGLYTANLKGRALIDFSERAGSSDTFSGSTEEHESEPAPSVIPTGAPSTSAPIVPKNSKLTAAERLAAKREAADAQRALEAERIAALKKADAEKKRAQMKAKNGKVSPGAAGTRMEAKVGSISVAGSERTPVAPPIMNQSTAGARAGSVTIPLPPPAAAARAMQIQTISSESDIFRAKRIDFLQAPPDYVFLIPAELKELASVATERLIAKGTDLGKVLLEMRDPNRKVDPEREQRKLDELRDLPKNHPKFGERRIKALIAEAAREEKLYIHAKGPQKEASLLKTQKEITNLIMFCITFEYVIGRFIGDNRAGPITEEYGRDLPETAPESIKRIIGEVMFKSSTVPKKPTLASTGASRNKPKRPTLAEIGKVYGYHWNKKSYPAPLVYKRDYSIWNRIVPPVSLIKKYSQDANYFKPIGSIEITSLVPTKIDIDLSEEELFALAKLELLNFDGNSHYIGYFQDAMAILDKLSSLKRASKELVLRRNLEQQGLTKLGVMMLMELRSRSPLAQRARNAVVDYPLPDRTDKIMTRLERFEITDENDLRAMYIIELLATFQIRHAELSSEKEGDEREAAIGKLARRLDSKGPIPIEFMEVVSEIRDIKIDPDEEIILRTLLKSVLGSILIPNTDEGNRMDDEDDD